MSAPHQTPAPAAPVLAVEGLNVGVRNTGLVHDVSFTIGRGERVGLIGESGSGKSLTGLSLIGLLPEDVHATGSVRLAGVDSDIIGASEAELSRLRGKDVAMVFQEPMTALNPTMRIGDQVAESMLVHGTAPDRDAARKRAVELLAMARVPNPEAAARAYPHQFSGGQRQRVVLAIALANDPSLLICDEPTTALDVTVQKTVLDLIVNGVEERDAAMLFITHDLGVIANVCERVLVMYGGRIVESGPVMEVFRNPQHRYTQGLLAASDLVSSDAHRQLPTIRGTVPSAGRFPAGCVFNTRCDHATDACTTQPPWMEIAPDQGFACFHPAGTEEEADGELASTTTAKGSEDEDRVPYDGALLGAEHEPSDPAVRGQITVSDVTRRYTRPRRSLFSPAPTIDALRGVSFTIDPGERFGIVGESGCGKSTLLRILAGLDQPTSGSVEIEGTDIARLSTRNLRFLRSRLQLVFQDPMSSLDPRMRVKDIVAEPIVAQRLRPPKGTLSEHIERLLTEVGLRPEVASRYPHQFSGGQRQRISIARALAPQPAILLADEPVSALDVSVRAQVLNLINDLVDQLDLTLVFVSHDLSVVRHVCDRVAVMRDGEIVELGPTEEVYTNPQHDYTKTLLAAVPDLRAALAASRDTPERGMPGA